MPGPFSHGGGNTVRSETILFDDHVPAGTVRMVLERSLKYRGKIREMTIVFYPGQQKTLEVNPYMLRAPDLYVPLTKYVGDRKYFSGDDSKFEIQMVMPFFVDDKLVVEVNNTSAFDYDLYVLFEIDYEVV